MHASEREIKAMENEASVLASEGENPYPGMSYVEGVAAALGWVLEGGDPPLDLP